MPAPSLDGRSPDARPATCDRHTAAVIACIATLLSAPSAGAQRVQPLFELFATYGRPALAPSVADVYAAAAGGVRAGGGVGAAAGVRIGPVEVAGFYEIGSASVARAAAGRPSDFTRNSVGARFEVPLLELGRDFRGLLSASLFRQTLDSVVVVLVPGVTASLSQADAYGGRVEVGVEHRGFIGTTWFITGGLAAANAGRGNWRDVSNIDNGRFGVAPILTLGLRTREW